MSKEKKPEVGDRIQAYCAWSDTELTGKVLWVGSTQFTWAADDHPDHTFFTNFNGMWKKLDGKN